MYFCRKNQQFWFLSFFTTTSIKGWFLANLATLPPPHGSPHPTTHLTTYLYVFCVQRAQKPCLIIKIQLLLHFSKVGVGNQFWPFLAFGGHLSVRRAVRGWLKNAKPGFPLVIHMGTRAKTSAEHVQSILCNSWTRQHHMVPIFNENYETFLIVV